MRLLHPLFLFRSVKGFFPPLTWNEEVLEFDSSAECTTDHAPRMTMIDWVDLLLPDVEVQVSDINMAKMPTVIFQGVPLKAAILAFKAFLAFRKIEIPGKNNCY